MKKSQQKKEEEGELFERKINKLADVLWFVSADENQIWIVSPFKKWRRNLFSVRREKCASDRSDSSDAIVVVIWQNKFDFIDFVVFTLNFHFP